MDGYNEELQKKFLLFTTGSDRVPVGGMGEMTFKITRMVQKQKHDSEGNRTRPEKLPEAHTCFNQLVLPGKKKPKNCSITETFSFLKFLLRNNRLILPTWFYYIKLTP